MLFICFVCEEISNCLNKLQTSEVMRSVEEFAALHRHLSSYNAGVRWCR